MEPPRWSGQSVPLEEVLVSTRDFLSQFEAVWPKWWLTGVCLRPDDEDSWKLLALEAFALFGTDAPEIPLEFRSDHIVIASRATDFSEISAIISQHQPPMLCGISPCLPPPTQEGNVTSSFLSEQLGTSRLIPRERLCMCASVLWRPNQQQTYKRDEAWHEAVAAGYGAFEHLVADQLGVSSFDTSPKIEIVAPLGLDCTFPNPELVRLKYRRPFFARDWQVLAPSDGRLRPSASPAPAADGEVSNDVGNDGWYTQTFTVPTDCQRVWLRHPLLGRRLLRWDAPYQHQAQARPLESLDYLVGAVYRTGDTDSLQAAADRWMQQLKSVEDTKQELALANALARLGYSVLFGGKQTQCQDVDLVVLDHVRARALLIDAHTVHKGSGVNAVRKKVEELQTRVVELATYTTGWTIMGAVVSTISEEQVPSVPLPQHVHVLGVADIEKLGRLSRAAEAEALLWRHPQHVSRTVSDT